MDINDDDVWGGSGLTGEKNSSEKSPLVPLSVKRLQGKLLLPHNDGVWPIKERSIGTGTTVHNWWGFFH